MSGNISDQTTVLSNLSLTGNLAVAAGGFTSAISQSQATIGTLNGSRVSSSVSILGLAGWFSQVSASVATAGTLATTGGIIASGVTFDMQTNSVIPSLKTYGVNPSGFTIGQWGFNFNASGMSIFYSSGKSIYFFGGSTLSAVQS